MDETAIEEANQRHQLAGILARQRPLEKMREDWVRRDAPPELLSADVLARRMNDTCLAAQVLISIGHDDYRASSGGVQLCMALEAKGAAQVGVDYQEEEEEDHTASPEEDISDDF